MEEYPKMLFRKGGEEMIDGHFLQALTVQSAEEEEGAGKSGFVSFDVATSEQEDDILDMSVAKMADALVEMDDSELLALEQREKDGKTRKTALKAIAEEIAKR